MSVRAETKEEAHDNESANNARKSEAKNVAHVVSRDASPGLICGQGDGLRLGASNVAHADLLEGERHSQRRPEALNR